MQPEILASVLVWIKTAGHVTQLVIVTAHSNVQSSGCFQMKKQISRRKNSFGSASFLREVTDSTRDGRV